MNNNYQVPKEHAQMIEFIVKNKECIFVFVPRKRVNALVDTFSKYIRNAWSYIGNDTAYTIFQNEIDFLVVIDEVDNTDEENEQKKRKIAQGIFRNVINGQGIPINPTHFE